MFRAVRVPGRFSLNQFCSNQDSEKLKDSGEKGNPSCFSTLVHVSVNVPTFSYLIIINRRNRRKKPIVNYLLNFIFEYICSESNLMFGVKQKLFFFLFRYLRIHFFVRLFSFYALSFKCAELYKF